MDSLGVAIGARAWRRRGESKLKREMTCSVSELNSGSQTKLKNEIRNLGHFRLSAKIFFFHMEHNFKSFVKVSEVGVRVTHDGSPFECFVNL